MQSSRNEKWTEWRHGEPATTWPTTTTSEQGKKLAKPSNDTVFPIFVCFLFLLNFLVFHFVIGRRNKQKHEPKKKWERRKCTQNMCRINYHKAQNCRFIYIYILRTFWVACSQRNDVDSNELLQLPCASFSNRSSQISSKHNNHHDQLYCLCLVGVTIVLLLWYCRVNAVGKRTESEGKPARRVDRTVRRVTQSGPQLMQRQRGSSVADKRADYVFGYNKWHDTLNAGKMSESVEWEQSSGRLYWTRRTLMVADIICDPRSSSQTKMFNINQRICITLWPVRASLSFHARVKWKYFSIVD